MDRRKFIFNSGLGTIGVLIIPSIVSCSDKDQVNLEDLLGKSTVFLPSTSFVAKEGNNDFGYYYFNDTGFTHQKYKGNEAFVFYKGSKIVGFTIQIEGIDFVKEEVEKFSKLYNNYKVNFENDFGKEYQWSGSNKLIRLSYNDYKVLPKLTFYSEFFLDSFLIL